MTKTVKLGEICEIVAGQSPPSETYNNSCIGLPFYQGKADFGVLYPKTRMWCSQPQKIAQPDDILMSVRAPVGPTNICKEKSCIGRGLTAIRAGVSVYSKYILHYLRSIEHELANKGNGSTFAAITQAEVKAIEIPLPPLPEQRRIAALLDHADALRQKDRQLLAHYDSLAQSIFLELFGDPVRNEKGWEVKRLRHFINNERGISYGVVQRGDHIEDGVPVVRIKDIIENTFNANSMVRAHRSITDKYKRTYLKGNELLISIRGTVGKLSRVPKQAIGWNISREVAIIPLNEGISPTFLLEQLRSSAIQNLILDDVKGVAQSGINLSDLKETPVTDPPFALQTHFAQAIEQIEQQKAVVRQQIAASEALFGRLLQENFG